MIATKGDISSFNFKKYKAVDQIASAVNDSITLSVGESSTWKRMNMEMIRFDAP